MQRRRNEHYIVDVIADRGLDRQRLPGRNEQVLGLRNVEAGGEVLDRAYRAATRPRLHGKPDAQHIRHQLGRSACGNAETADAADLKAQLLQSFDGLFDRILSRPEIIDFALMHDAPLRLNRLV